METTKSSFSLSIIKGVLLILIMNLAFVLLFAGVLKVFLLDNDIVKIVNQIAKILILLSAGLISLKSGKIIIRSAVQSSLGLAVSYLIFMALSSQVFDLKSIAIEIAFGLISGLIIGAVVKVLK